MSLRYSLRAWICTFTVSVVVIGFLLVCYRDSRAHLLRERNKADAQIKEFYKKNVDPRSYYYAYDPTKRYEKKD